MEDRLKMSEANSSGAVLVAVKEEVEVKALCAALEEDTATANVVTVVCGDDTDADGVVARIVCRIEETLSDERRRDHARAAMCIVDGAIAEPGVLEDLRGSLPTAFLAVWSSQATTAVAERQRWFDAGANQVTHDHAAAQHVLQQLQLQHRTAGKHTCSMCGLSQLSEEGIFVHYPLYHINTSTEDTVCPICGKRCNTQVHIRNRHIPNSLPGIEPEKHGLEDSYCFALVVCRSPITDRYLVVQEFANVGFWLPGGRVDIGETFKQAAIRETVEEGGVDIKLTGILQIETRSRRSRHRPTAHRRTRVIFLAEPKDPSTAVPKSVPDFESVGACWVTKEEVLSKTNGVKWRGKEPQQWITHVAHGGRILPLDAMDERTA